MDSLATTAASNRGSRPKAPRKRPITSCVECSRRKQKCNREWPCNHCLSRRVADMCRYVAVKPQSTRKEDDEGTGAATGTVQGPKLSNILSTDSDEDEGGLLNLESIGYVNSGTSNLVSDLESLGLGKKLTPVPLADNRMRTRDEVLKLLPERHVVDFLVNYFLQEVNWIYEMIHPPTFLKRYDSWWLQTNYFGEDDIQFTILILRLCACSLQFLPHPKYPTQAILAVSVETMEMACHSAACKLDEYRPRPRSLLRIQQLYFHISYLKNSSKINECARLLDYTVKEAQQMGLHLQRPDINISEFDMEMRRRTFWNLYVWDRFMSTFLGRWPLIPEERCSIDLPHDSIPYDGLFNGPTPFMERNLQIKITQLMGRFYADYSKNPPNELTIAENSRFLQEEFVERLPPVFKLFDPDLSFDSLIPSIPLKREHQNIAVYGAIANLHRASCQTFEGGDLQQHSQSIFMESCISALQSIQRLHKLMGGGPHRYFMLSMGTMEGAAALGICLMSRKSSKLSDHPSTSELDLRQRGFAAFREAMALLELLSPSSLIAKKGVVVLGLLHHKLLAIGNFEAQDQPVHEWQCLEIDETKLLGIGLEPGFENTSTVEWANIAMSPNMEWFFDDDIFQAT